ncbi:MAG: T9SS type A sorting domain-containing protein, partial [bacterium]
FLPYRYDSSVVIDSNCLSSIITDNFALMYCWRQGDPKLASGETRYVKFIAHRMVGVEEQPSECVPRITMISVAPTLARDAIRIEFDLLVDDEISIAVYDAAGRLAKRIARNHYSRGKHQIEWNIRSARVPTGVYFVRVHNQDISVSEKVVVTRP